MTAATAHRIRARAPSNKVFVGWNSAVRIFVCRIENASGNRTLGASELTDLAAMMKPYAYLSNDMRTTLRADREATAS